MRRTKRIAGAASATLAALVTAAHILAGLGLAPASAAASEHRQGFKTMCLFTVPVRCEVITHDGAPGSNVVLNRFDRGDPIQQDWNLVKVINPATHKNLVTRTWPPAAQWVRNKYRGMPVYMNVAVFSRTCQGSNAPPLNDAPVSHCHGRRSVGVVWIVLGKIMHKAALVSVRQSSAAGFPMFLEGTVGAHIPQPSLVHVGPGCHTARHAGVPCDIGIKHDFWRRFGG